MANANPRQRSTRRRFIEYARVSKVGDRDEDKLLSPEIQISSMDRYAEHNDIDIIDRIIDLDESGRSFERRAIKGIIERIKAGEADGVLVWKWSRWGRNVERSKIYLRKVKIAGGEVIASTEDIDTKTAIGKLQLTFQQGIDQFQSDTISEGWKEAKALRIKEGLTGGGAAPFGYERTGTREPFRPHPVNGPIVAELYERYLRGQGPQALAGWLNNEKKITSTRGNKFTVGTVTRILDSGFAAGYLRLDVYEREEDDDGNVTFKPRKEPGRWERGAHESIIDEQTWRVYQRERDRRRSVHPKSRQPRWYLGAGLTVCARCGGNLIVNSYATTKSQALCSTYKSARTCAGVWINRNSLELVVALWLGGHVTEWADRQDELRGTDDERVNLAKELDVAKADEAQLDEGRRNALALVGRGLATDGEYLGMITDIEHDRQRVTERISELTARLEGLSPDADVYGRIAQGAEGQTSEEWNAILRRVMRRVVVAPDTITIEPWRGERVIYDRALIALRRPHNEKDTKRDATGRFAVKRS